MNSKDYLHRIRKINPTLFAANEIKIKVQSLEILLEHAYMSGAEQGAKEGVSIGGKFNEIFTAMEKATRLK